MKKRMAWGSSTELDKTGDKQKGGVIVLPTTQLQGRGVFF